MTHSPYGNNDRMANVKRFIKRFFASVIKHNIGALAAIVSFFAFSSLIPVLAFLIIIASRVIPSHAVEEFLQEILRSYVPLIPMEGTFVSATVTRLAHYETSVSIIGLLSLLWSTVGGFVTLQWILDTIFEVRKRRAFFRQYVVGFAMIGILLVLTIAASLVTAISPQVAAKMSAGNVIPLLEGIRIVGWALFPIILLVTCYCCFRLLPSRRLSNLALWVASLLATVLIYLSRVLFGVYTHHLGNYELMYGTLTFIMLFVFWIYIVFNILLVGAEVAATIDALKTDTKVEPTRS